MVEPDLAGFRTAQATLREKLGRDVIFVRYEQPTYPSGTQLDPESGLPYDPTIEPTASGVTTASARVSILHKPVGTQADEEASPLGWLETGEAVLSIDPVIFDGLELDTFDQVEMLDERWQIQQDNPDAIGNGDPHRVLMKVRKT